jgi:hypothetical protein
MPLGVKAALMKGIPAIHRDKMRFYTRLVSGGRIALRDCVAALLSEACAERDWRSRWHRLPCAPMSTPSPPTRSEPRS